MISEPDRMGFEATRYIAVRPMNRRTRALGYARKPKRRSRGGVSNILLSPCVEGPNRSVDESVACCTFTFETVPVPHRGLFA